MTVTILHRPSTLCAARRPSCGTTARSAPSRASSSTGRSARCSHGARPGRATRSRASTPITSGWALWDAASTRGPTPRDRRACAHRRGRRGAGPSGTVSSSLTRAPASTRAGTTATRPAVRGLQVEPLRVDPCRAHCHARTHATPAPTHTPTTRPASRSATAQCPPAPSPPTPTRTRAGARATGRWAWCRTW